MTTERITNHTPGALRAAVKIYAELFSSFRDDANVVGLTEKIAAIIDRETGLPELLEALEGSHLRSRSDFHGRTMTPTDMPKAYWHIHHDRLVEFATEPIENRIAYIKESKDAEEVPTRLRLLHEVKGALPDAVIVTGKAYVQAGQAYDQTKQAYDQAVRAYVQAGQVCRQALHDHKSEIEALHAIECPNCPWDGTTIFPKLQEEGD